MQSVRNHPSPARPDVPIISIHAVTRMRERFVSFAAVCAVLAAPFVVQPSKQANCCRAFAPAVCGGRHAWLVVVLDLTTGVVVTVYWYSVRSAAARSEPTVHPRRRQLRSEEVSHDAA